MEISLIQAILKEDPNTIIFKLDIKEERLHHPNNVHSAGTILFFRLYQRYGADVVKKLLLLLAEMENPCTCDYLNLIRTEYNAEIAEYIEKAIVEKNNETILQ